MTAKPGDVSKASGAELAGLMTGAGAVIFAASASPNGGVEIAPTSSSRTTE